MNKKGQADIVGNVLKVLPKPILFLFFILLLSFITFLLSPVFNSFGVFCDSGGGVIRIPESNIITNFQLMRGLPTVEEIGGSIDPGGFGYDCKEFYNGSNRFTMFEQCHFCPSGVLDVNDVTLCMSDVFNWDSPDDNMSWWNRVVFCPLTTCQIPSGYFFSVETGFYECLGDCSSLSLADERDKKLAELGGMPYYPVSYDDNSYRSFFMFSCTDSLRVEPTIKGVPIFRLSFWFIIILIILMLWAIINFGHKK